MVNRSYWLLLFFWSLLGFSGWALNKWMPSFLETTFKLTQTNAGLLSTGCIQGAAVFGVLAGGAWADKLSRTNPRGRIVVPVVGLIIASLSVLLAANSSLLPVVLIGLVGYGLARIFSDANVMPILTQITDKRYRATGYGILNMFSCLVGGVGVILGGVMSDMKVNPSYIFDVAAVVILCSAVVMSMIKFAPKP